MDVASAALRIRHPLIALASSLRYQARAYVWLPLHGHHYVYGDIRIHVVQNDGNCRWVSLADIRKVVAVTASERALANACPGRLQNLGASTQKPTRAMTR